MALREKFPAPAFERDRLSYLVSEAVTSEPLLAEGKWRSRLALSSGAGQAHERELLVVNVPPVGAKALDVALVDVPELIANQLKSIPDVAAAPFVPGKNWDVVVFCGGPDGAQKNTTTDADGADVTRAALVQPGLPAALLVAVRAGLPLLALPSTEG